jgi:NDP-sugar pyrophosphorylase family protein
MIRALIMAGGRSERMRATAGPLHKALVTVSGVPLIEHNLQTLLSQGFRDIAIAVNEAEFAIGDYVQTRGRDLATAASSRLEVIWEREPLGTIGAARIAMGESEAMVVVNVDNLTSIDLNSFAAYHFEIGATLTIAAHEERFQIPFGELQLSGNRILQYIEKPLKPFWISSGTYVLSREVCSFIPAGERTDIPLLVSRLLNSGRHVAAFRHHEDWIDVNDAAAVSRAETRRERV